MDSPATIEPAQPAPDFRSVVFQSYLQGLKGVWKDDIYRDVVREAAPHAGEAPERIEAAMRHHASYRLYGWLERHLQRFKYVSRYGMLPVMEARAEQLTRWLDEGARIHPGRLRLDPGIELPDYYVEADFHQHPGGVWSDDVDAFAYEWGANAFSFAMAAADAPYRWMADWLVSRFAPRRVLDLGCGFGKLVIPLKARDRAMEVTGIDLSAPLLRLAHRRAIEAGLEISLLQANAESTGLPAGRFDAVACYWLLHEMPAEAIRRTLREARRLLAPGGVFASFDMHAAPGGNIGAFLHMGHAARNNEPFLPGLVALDLPREFAEAGFASHELVDAMTGAPATDARAPLAPTRTHAFTVALGVAGS